MAFFRRPKTTQERKLYVGLCADQKDLDVVVKFRPKRSAQNLPNAWDDQMKASHGVKSWKVHRNQQHH